MSKESTSTISVAGNQIDIEITQGPARNWQASALEMARDAAKAAGLEWLDCSVFVKLPEPGRCFTKKPGYTNLIAHG